MLISPLFHILWLDPHLAIVKPCVESMYRFTGNTFALPRVKAKVPTVMPTHKPPVINESIGQER